MIWRKEYYDEDISTDRDRTGRMNYRKEYDYEQES